MMPCKPKSGTFSLREKSGSSPRAPLFLLALLWIKKLDTEDFKLKQTAAKFSANIIWLLVYLFVGIFLLEWFQLNGIFEAAAAKEVEETGEKTPIFPAGKVAIWIAKQSAARQIYGCFEMVSPPRKQ